MASGRQKAFSWSSSHQIWFWCSGCVLVLLVGAVKTGDFRCLRYIGIWWSPHWGLKLWRRGLWVNEGGGLGQQQPLSDEPAAAAALQNPSKSLSTHPPLPYNWAKYPLLTLPDNWLYLKLSPPLFRMKTDILLLSISTVLREHFLKKKKKCFLPDIVQITKIK